jgi:zinc transporter 2
LIQSVGGIVAGALITYNPSFKLADPICTLLFSVLVIFTTYGVIVSSTHVLMEATPVEVDLALLRKALLRIPHGQY